MGKKKPSQADLLAMNSKHIKTPQEIHEGWIESLKNEQNYNIEGLKKCLHSSDVRDKERARLLLEASIRETEKNEFGVSTVNHMH